MRLSARPLGRTGLAISPLGFGAFKIGRNEKIKYPQPYDLPDEMQVAALLEGLLALGVNYFDTAPAYGVSEERIGRWLQATGRRDEIVLSSKVGETFENGVSTYDFASVAIRQSVERSLRRLQTDWLDLLLIHSNGDDLVILRETDAVSVLRDLKESGVVRAIGLSGKTAEGAFAALEWADVIMVEYHLRDDSHAAAMTEAHARGVGVVVKKALAAGRLRPEDALRYVFSHPAVGSAVVGGLNLQHFRSNVEVVEQLLAGDC